MIASDVALLTGFGFIDPIFALFITQKITVGNVGEAARVAGFAIAIYWGVLSLLMISFGRYLEKTQGEKDDIYFIIIGNILAAVAVFGYIFSSLPWHIYVLKGIYALGMAMNIPGWTAIFTRHIDKGKEAFEWATRATVIGIGAGVSGALGGVIASKFGFNILFVGVGIFILVSALLPFLIYREIYPKDKVLPRVPPTKEVSPPLPKV